MHLVDRGAGLALRALPERHRVFRDGWGDERLLQHLDITAVAPPLPLDLVWERSWMEDGVTVSHGSYESPFADMPIAARSGIVVGIEPRPDTSRWCVLLPSWNDEGFATRRRLAAHLAERGIASLIPEAALYGRRRVEPGGMPIRTVADFAVMSRSIVEEARSLVEGLVAAGHEVGVAGYSMGGSIAAVVGATLDCQVALAPLAASHAPDEVFVRGVIRSSVAWSALGDRGRERLSWHLSRPSPLRLAPAPSTRTAVLVGATGDGFVPRPATEAIHRHWPGSEMRWVDAGHATLLWRGMDVLAGAIGASFDRVYGGSLQGGAERTRFDSR